MSWRRISGEEMVCTTDTCWREPAWRLEVDGVASVYCWNCKTKIEYQAAMMELLATIDGAAKEEKAMHQEFGMTTATEAIKSRDEEHRKRSFEYGIESFLNQWKPQDRREASQFEAELHSLIRQVYADAQAPILERFTQLAMSVPMPFNVLHPHQPGNK